MVAELDEMGTLLMRLLAHFFFRTKVMAIVDGEKVL